MVIIKISKLKHWLLRIIRRKTDSPVDFNPFEHLKQKGHIPKDRMVKEGDTVVHLGVWRIETIEQWAKLVGNHGQVIIVEGDELNHQINQIEVKRRLLTNVSVVNRCVWDKKENITLQISDISRRNKIKEAQTIDRINPDSNYRKEKIIVGDTLDNILQELNVTRINHVFMSISGSEIEALGGMNKIIETNSDLSLYIRAILLNENTGNSNSYAVAEFLENKGFRVQVAPREKNRDGSNVYAEKVR